MPWNYEVIDLNDAITRAMGRKELYKGWLDAFLKDESFVPVAEAFKNKDPETARNALHKLKSTAGNLSVMSVFRQAEALGVKIKESADFDSLDDDLKALSESFYSAKKMHDDNISELLNYGELSF
ncbi:MAG: hypothetical protein LBC82_08645 [Oscillospiraceae bacterium]|jgi:HPt (histidine-containing phosphotransfer) domain-containing protein|nr:hypothetical protein [Oscillospiraceae bacterium]